MAVLGASGYTGAEAVRLLESHPKARLAVATADRQAGQPLGEVFPHLAGASGGVELKSLEESGVEKEADAVIACLPPATTQEVIASLPDGLPVVDLSADFRLRDPALYEQWYGNAHRAPQVQARAAYGLTELHREEVANSTLVANPGCYPTCAQLPSRPLLRKGLIDGSQGVVVDAISGVSGAGRSPRQGTMLCEAGEGARHYGVSGHRHCPEMEQGLSESAGLSVPVEFKPHLGAFSRGMIATVHATLKSGATPEECQKELEHFYEGEPFVRVLPFGSATDSHHVRGSNMAHLCAAPSRIPGKVSLLCSIDNLLKGATGQAIQNLNALLGFPEHSGIDFLPAFP